MRGMISHDDGVTFLKGIVAHLAQEPLKLTSGIRATFIGESVIGLAWAAHRYNFQNGGLKNLIGMMGAAKLEQRQPQYTENTEDFPMR